MVFCPSTGREDNYLGGKLSFAHVPEYFNHIRFIWHFLVPFTWKPRAKERFTDRNFEAL